MLRTFDFSKWVAIAFIALSLFSFGISSAWMPFLILPGTILVVFTAMKKLGSATINKNSVLTFFFLSFWLIPELFYWNAVSIDLHYKALIESLLYIIVSITLVGVLCSGSLPRSFSPILIIWCLIVLLSFFLYLVGFFSEKPYFRSFYDNRNLLATTLVFISSAGLFLVLKKRSKAAYFLLIFGLVTVLSTLSSKGLIGYFALIAIYFIYRFSLPVYIVLLFFCLFLLLGSYIVFPEPYLRIFEKVQAIFIEVDRDSLVNNSALLRRYLIDQSISVFLDYPLKGVGLNNAQFYMNPPDGIYLDNRVNTQNNYSELLVNNGLFGFAFFYAPFLYVLFSSLAMIMRRHASPTVWFVFATIVIKLMFDIGMKSYNQFNHVFFSSFAIYLFFYLKQRAKHSRSSYL